MTSRFGIFILALLPLISSDSSAYGYEEEPMSFVNMTSKNLYIEFECLKGYSLYVGKLQHFKFFLDNGAMTYDWKELIFDSCHTILFHQKKKNGSYCLARKYYIEIGRASCRERVYGLV